MILYIVLIFAMTVCVFADSSRQKMRLIKKRESISVVLTMIFSWILFLISGFRYNTGTDYINYAQNYETKSAGIDTYWLNYEPGFNFLNFFVSKTFGEVQFLFIICSGVTMYFIYRSYKKSSADKYLSLYLFVTLYFFFSSFNYVRQYMAISLVLFAVDDLINKNFKNYLIKVAVASLFHSTSLLMIPFYFIARRKVRLGVYIPLTAILMLSRIFYQQIIVLVTKIMPKYAIYLDFEGGGATVSLLLLMMNFVVLLAITYKKRKNIEQKEEIKYINNIENIYLNACFFALCFYSFASINTLFSRIGSYFFIFSTLSIPYVINKKCKGRDLLMARIIVCAISIIACLYYLNANNCGVVPYKCIFTR